MNEHLGQKKQTARARGLMTAALLLACAFGTVTHAAAQKSTSTTTPSANASAAEDSTQEKKSNVVQVVALDECDPATFNAALGPDFCHNVALGAFTTLSDLFSKAAAGTPDPGWDFEPDALKIKEGTTLVVTDQGGEPHTFTEVKKFGGGFITGLNAGEDTVPECTGGFSNVAVAKTRILQGSHTDITDLSKGEHLFQCCIHPWMRMKVEVK